MVEHNHSWREIKEYTLNELGVFAREVLLTERRKANESILHSWLGTNADKKFIDGLFKKQGVTKAKSDVKSQISATEAKKEWTRLAANLRTLGLAN